MDTTSRQRGYAILGTPRSGSSHLCRLVTSTGVLGKPREYLNLSHEAGLFRDYPYPEHDIWEKIRVVSRTENGVFAVKAFYGQFGRFDPQDIQHNILTLPIVFLTRNDSLGQALSLAKALQTAQWSSRHVEAREAPKYDVELIDTCLNQILHHEVTLRYIFAVNGTEPLHLIYEDFVEDPTGTVRRIGMLLGIDDISIQPQSPLLVQRDAVNEEWRQRYIRDRGTPDSLRRFAVPGRWVDLRRRLAAVLSRLARSRP